LRGQRIGPAQTERFDRPLRQDHLIADRIKEARSSPTFRDRIIIALVERQFLRLELTAAADYNE
jgi:hypothetical protein